MNITVWRPRHISKAFRNMLLAMLESGVIRLSIDSLYKSSRHLRACIESAQLTVEETTQVLACLAQFGYTKTKAERIMSSGVAE